MLGGEITKKNCTRDTLRRHCDHDTTWERKPKRNLKGRGFKSKCLPIFVCYLLWTIIKRPLVLHIASVISPGLLLLLYGHDWKRVVKNIEVKNEILGIFIACCWSVLYYGKSEGQWARCLKIGRNLGQIYWSWRSWNPPPTSRAKSIKKSRQNSSFSIQWNGQAPRKTNQIEQNTGTKISLSSKISLKVVLGFAFRA